MDKKLNEVREHVESYFKEHLSKYTVLEIRRKSYHPDDDYLYMVSAEKDDGTYAVWTSWNEAIQSLNYGHYDLPSVEDCEKIFEEYQNIQLYCEVYKCSQDTRLRLFVAETEEATKKFCEEHEAELLLERQEHYEADRKKMSMAYEAKLPILDYGGYNTCQDCKNADHDTQISELDDFCSVICHDPDCLEHKKHKK